MTEQTLLHCRKQNHKELKFIFLNFSSESEENLFYCPICITKEQFQKYNDNLQNTNVLILDQIQNMEINQENIVGWPPIRDKYNEQIYQDSLKFLKDYGSDYSSIVNILKDKILNFYDDFYRKITAQIQNQKKEALIQLEKYCQHNFQSQNQETDQNKVQEIISKFDVKILREKLQEFQTSQINVSQLYQFKQEQNKQIFNNAQIFSSLTNQLEKIKEINQELQKQFTKIEELIVPFESYKINLDTVGKNNTGDMLKFFKNTYKECLNKGNFEVDNENGIVKFNSDQWSCIYSENLIKEKKYHLKFKIDFKNHVQNMYLNFSLTDDKDKETKDLQTDNYVRIFDRQNESSEIGGEFRKQGKEFYEFFNDNYTIINLVFNIQEKYMEFYDEGKYSYQRLALKTENIQNWILVITYCQSYSKELPTTIQFLK
ncbi:hypothetical protein PPERSA_07066 [Pseudocohnilembus persalinus]|uniref:Uncharacterized protein n=1 Tax=Pseudocohnilembus persalinus TaxID=266149 RepID=A0A0V0QAQ2_PSEPJ|nr:hypothetical protein PPERSA_07066 [Pseudocohnilembus persalinus]|eukprot:KRW99294.1 hypothetical protein PPERSA_07066 [Pseudocohnilembus persalinus]